MFTLALGLLTGHSALAALVAAAALALGMAWLSNEPEIVRLAALGLANKTTGLLNTVRNVVVKTANYALDGTDASGTIFYTLGAAGEVDFTLPAAAARYTGVEYEFANAVDQIMKVVGAAGTVITFNNAAATSVAAQTAGQKIGARMRAFCDGTKWHVTGTTVGVTYTVA